MYVWFHTAPEKSELSRYEHYVEQGVEVVYPELKCAYLFDYLIKMGAVISDGMGTSPLSWQEINAWMQATDIRLNVWELTTIRRASEIYANQMVLSKKPECPMPERVVAQDQTKLAKHIKNILR